jgi:hypothetical protein
MSMFKSSIPRCAAVPGCVASISTRRWSTFAADIDWLKSQGVTVERANLAQQPQAFADHAQVRQLLQEQGAQALPAILIDGELKSSGRYPARAELARWAGVSALSAIGVTTAPAVNACCAPAAGSASTCC